jgi:hypothetical protein
MPRTFTWWDCDVYVPLDKSDPTAQSFMTVLRLRPGFTKQQAAGQILPIFEQMRREHPSLEQTAVDLNSINDRFKRSLGKALYFILAAVVLLLGIGCLNVSILLLAHGASRQREFALRMALGANVGKIAQQSLTEAALISLLGTLIGLVISWRTLPIVTAFLPWQLFPNGLHVPLDARVFLLSAALALLTSLAIALLPAFQAARSDIRQLLHSGLQVAGPTVWIQVTYLILVSMQIALSIVLVTTTATAIDNYRALLSVPLGYDPDHLADFSIPIHVNSYDVLQKRATYLRELRDRVREIPGVISSSLGVIGPPYSDWDFNVEVLGQARQKLELCNVNFVDAGYRWINRYKESGPEGLLNLSSNVAELEEVEENIPNVPLVNREPDKELVGARAPQGREAASAVAEPAPAVRSTSNKARQLAEQRFKPTGEKRPTSVTLDVWLDDGLNAKVYDLRMAGFRKMARESVISDALMQYLDVKPPKD